MDEDTHTNVILLHLFNKSMYFLIYLTCNNNKIKIHILFFSCCSSVFIYNISIGLIFFFMFVKQIISEDAFVVVFDAAL